VKSVTDIEKTIEEIKKLQQNNTITTEINEHLVFLCNSNTEKIIQEALKENGLQIDKDKIHIFVSEYYGPGDVYNVTDKKLKRKILKQHGIEIQEKEYLEFKTYYTYDCGTNNSYTINYTTTNDSGFYSWR
jgi:hypothetical protein